MVLELCTNGPRPSVLARLGLIAVLAVVCSGRDFLGWGISGHLTCVWRSPSSRRSIDACRSSNTQGAAARWSVIRWTLFDQGDHSQTYFAVVVAAAAAAVSLGLGRLPVAGPSR